MLRWLDTHFDQMALTIIVWLCSLPLIVLIVLPLLGLEVAAVAALTMLIIALAMCWGICAWKVFKG
ncbi:MAG TPA: hypothetical protein VJ793_04750 [Anaerolineae bacterium]|nr:hypothetical protein [Anaerolineae bacterium]